jgi:hypothetical protein
VAATVTWGGEPVLGATLLLSGGPDSLPPTAPTSAVGNVYTFANVPEGSGYTLTASKTTANGDGSATVNAITVVDGATTSIPVAFETATVDVEITKNGIPVSGATVTLSGGPMGLSPITGASPFNFVPVGSGYTVSATLSGNGGGSDTATGVVVSAPSTTVPLVFKSGTVRVSVNWATLAVPAASIRLTGPGGVDITQTADLSGVSDFTVPVGSGYSVAVTKTTANGNSNTVSAAVPGTVDDVTIVPVTVNLTPTRQVTVTVNWGTRAPASATPIPVTGAAVTLAGGPLGVPFASANPHTNAAGQWVFAAVPAGTNYTASATKTGSTGSSSSPAAINATADTSATVTLTPVGALTVTVKRLSTGVLCTGWAVRVWGGPAPIPSGSPVILTTTATGVVTFSSLPAAAGYTIRVTKASRTSPADLTNQTVPNGSVVMNVASC